MAAWAGHVSEPLVRAQVEELLLPRDLSSLGHILEFIF